MRGPEAYLLLISLCLSVARGNVIVNTNSGKVAGREVNSIIPNEKYYSFLSVPYAQPPLRKLRFMPPKPHPGWTETLDATKERKHCAQIHQGRATKSYGFCGDEDCLYLNIHTPKLPSSQDTPNLPIIFLVYNENLKTTFNASKDYGPDFFMKEEVIIVTVHYRIGSLGFLSFGDDLLPGNNGLRDIILALQWVKINIHNFGGDPKKLTLMGSQGGAALVDILLHSPKAKGLFSAVILQSGTSWNSMYFTANAKEKAITLSKELNQEAATSSFLIKRLSDVPTMTLVDTDHLAVHADEARVIQRGVVAFSPVVEHDHPDAVVTKLPEEMNLNIDIPVMIGYNSREAIDILQRYLTKPQYLTFADRDFLFLFPVRRGYNFQINTNVYRAAIREIKDHYFEEGYVKISQPGEYMTYINDIMSFYPIDYTVRKYTNESSSPIYYYMFDYSGEFNLRKKQCLEHALTIDGTWGASLGDELCYLFICNPIRKSYKKALEDEDSEEMKVMRNMVRLWTNFAKFGNPTPPGDPFLWKPASKDNKECLVINEELQMKSKLNEDKIKFWDEFLDKYQEMAIDGVVKDTKDEL